MRLVRRKENGESEALVSVFGKFQVMLERFIPVWIKEQRLLTKVRDCKREAKKWDIIGYHERAGDCYKMMAEAYEELITLRRKEVYLESRRFNLFRSCYHYWLETADRVSLEVLEKLISGYEVLEDAENANTFRDYLLGLTAHITDAEVKAVLELGRLKRNIMQELYEGIPEKAYEISLSVMEIATANSIDVENNKNWLIKEFERAPDLVLHFGGRGYKWRKKQIKKFYNMLIERFYEIKLS